ncbi:MULTISPECIES: NAD(P)-dependent oxidoreductase [unclassified Novosphingobium]|uniref:SDR family oxidoreductase n=1 Tax=unclassified Novosphingobium TaxID=2644732 RepID=UPI0025D4FF92|nr:MULTISPECIES: NAD(P)-dependent oxidoreductase [unclassified Novosphingobium]HQV02576.1 NAD(P)-dependent oxidoreductase [Novosphingobium sp.]
MSRIYMAGVGGMLGEAFHHVFSGSHELMCTDKDVNADWLGFCDFRDRAEYRRQVLDFKPDYLFHIGAHTSLEYCEDNVDDAYATNTLPVEDAVWLANRLDVPLLYISTAGIFDGAQETYDDWDQPNPLGHYARSKYMGERFVVENAQRYLVCRAGWMMGAGPAKDKKFIQKLAAQLKAGAKELKVVDDKLGTPTYTRDFAAQVKVLVEQELWGLYNMVCQGVTSRFEVAEYLVKALGKADEIAVEPVSSDYFAKEYFAPRPPSERLITKKLDLRGVNVMRDWRVCLDEYLADKYQGYLG